MGIKPKKDKKNNKGGAKLTLAKSSKNEVIAAAIVVSIFFLKLGYDATSYFISQHSTPPAESQAADQIATQQQNNLESMNNQNAKPAPNAPDMQKDANNIYQQTVQMQGSRPQAGPNLLANEQGAADNTIDIMARTPNRPKTGKMVMISVSESGRSNPFLPAAENFVPTAVAKLHLPPPPKQVFQGSDAAKIITTKISGIMYDRYSPSAIINIDGNDYLVRKGDVVNRYKVLSITPNQVIVQLGNNIYRAGVGQILSLSNINFNAIANLNHKFGGNVQTKRKH